MATITILAVRLHTQYFEGQFRHQLLSYGHQLQLYIGNGHCFKYMSCKPRHKVKKTPFEKKNYQIMTNIGYLKEITWIEWIPANSLGL